ncbi:hypothetical protein FA13DRAFT_1799091 [Coprinellus micaceus]|uniref:HAT C-terminal dimerisation domain-containing protein n=1 Tax=Coprinellus micaceus TaxID=71717 RepID=A0A4Y7SKC9_COPMI|nr:hypothetical protein FA13DRAFT_1799091 [Coprinellus micaceus]
MEIQVIIEDDGFWKAIKSIRNILQPLAVASNILQAPTTHMYHVLLTLGNLYQIFKTATGIPAEIAQGAIKSLERRWKDNADQELFILSIILNPYIHNRCFNSTANRNLTPAGLYKMAECACSRILKEDVGPGFFTAFMDYLHKHNNYSAQWMSLDSWKEEAAKMGKEPDIIRIWESIMPANSAGCECLFSKLGLVHMKK